MFKISLFCFYDKRLDKRLDDKRFYGKRLDDGINSLAYFDKDIRSQ